MEDFLKHNIYGILFYSIVGSIIATFLSKLISCLVTRVGKSVTSSIAKTILKPYFTTKLYVKDLKNKNRLFEYTLLLHTERRRYNYGKISFFFAGTFFVSTLFSSSYLIVAIGGLYFFVFVIIFITDILRYAGVVSSEDLKTIKDDLKTINDALKEDGNFMVIGSLLMDKKSKDAASQPLQTGDVR